ncbi:tail fiber protein [Flavivirga eckloniae]|uniref:Uncharacterized protein n=1 Tax=Flavivirga eckloniae TaxID=1803846 RepID=A0A2K9PRK6_9FLAO|nr:tail fiber protein [Flavivirga eckloniae]AUP79676.1 hypothetical protein C1H87_13550 [Flavivirga eckloniae]
MKKLHLLLILLFVTLETLSQTLYLPNAVSGITNSLNLNVGVGTGTIYPDKKFTVLGDVRLGMEGIGGGYQRNGILIQSNGTRTELRWQHFGQLTNPYIAVDPGVDATRLLFGTNGSDQMAIRHNGNVGIGTISPDSKLTVKGNIHTNEVKVDLLGAVGPDYVFYKNYDLKTLQEVENYISEKGHLPNIPSAKDMEINGIKLKEMNLKLLEKIEELTLYTINQEKEIKALKSKTSEIETLKRELQKRKITNKNLETRLQKVETLLNSIKQ